MLLDGIRAAVLVASLLVPSALFVRVLSTHTATGFGPAWSSVLVAIALAGMGGVAARALGARRRHWPAFATGGILGAVLAGVLA